MAYREIKGSRRYEYRYVEDGKFTGWADGGRAEPETLRAIVTGCGAAEYEVREICEAQDDTGTYVGRLIFSRLVRRSLLDN